MNSDWRVGGLRGIKHDKADIRERTIFVTSTKCPNETVFLWNRNTLSKYRLGFTMGLVTIMEQDFVFGASGESMQGCLRFRWIGDVSDLYSFD